MKPHSRKTLAMFALTALGLMLTGERRKAAMRSLSRRTCSLSLIFLATAALLAVSFPAQGIDALYFWCSLRDQRSTSTTAYFSEVFEGDDTDSGLFMNAFNAYVHANFTDVRGEAACSSASDRPAATADRDHEKDTERNIATGTIIQTNWKYTK
jgi:hypothetical protein